MLILYSLFRKKANSQPLVDNSAKKMYNMNLLPIPKAAGSTFNKRIYWWCSEPNLLIKYIMENNGNCIALHTTLILSSEYLFKIPGVHRPLNNEACAALEITPKLNRWVQLKAIPAESKEKEFTMRPGDWIKFKPVSGKMTLRYRAPELPIDFFNFIPGSDLDKSLMMAYDEPKIELERGEVAFVFNERRLASEGNSASSRIHGTSRKWIDMEDLIIFIKDEANLVKPITRVVARESAGKICAKMLTSALGRLGYNPLKSANPFAHLTIQ